MAPPIVAIVLAIATRRAVLSLLAGIFVGALLTTGGDFLQAILDTCEVHLWPTFIDPGKLRVFSFTLLMGAMIGVICRSGGMQGLIGLISPLAKTRRGGQLTTWLLGLVVFFDDYANTMLLGNTLRPVCDRLKISREKLAYLVDSTAAPVAGLALVSTWVAVEIDYVREGLEILGPETSLQAVDLFVASIPYRFYVLMALVLIPLIAITGRDFGPMVKAERLRLRGDIDDGGDDPLMAESGDTAPPARWYNAVLPIAVTLAVVMILLYVTGRKGFLAATGTEPQEMRDVLKFAQSSLSLQYGALAGLGVAVVLARVQNLMSNPAIADAIAQGVRVVFPAILILWAAGAMSRMTGNKSVEDVATKTPYEF
ncbi:MAG: Na+/H+ antiporter NhaC family protein, partial [Bythopirellula sp.]